MILYLDASALVKLYTEEVHADVVREAVAEATVLVCHGIGYVECRAAFARRRRQGGLAPDDHARCRHQLDRDWEQFEVVAASDELLRRAAALSEQYVLRAYDSVHLAAVEAVYGASRGRVEFRFAVFDSELSRAAKAAGIPLLES